ncbi:MAG: hypothetical protein U9Q97_08360 [Acidobacteriota bacterium]|nr:hypothetical protein [Acidobacteriota bacterium]
MQATLTFTLPEEQCEHTIAVQAMNWALVAWDMDQELRAIVKYGQEGYDLDTADKLRERLHEIIDDNNVSLDSIE